MTAGRGPSTCWLGHVETPARCNLASGNSIPAPQLVERYSKTIGNGDQGIAAAHGIEHVRRRRDGRGKRHHQRLNALQALAGAQMIGISQLVHRHAVFPRHEANESSAMTRW